MATWPQHKVTHAIGAALRAVEDAADGKVLEAALRGLLNVIAEMGVSTKDHDDQYIKPDVHIQMICKIGDDPSQTAQARHMAVCALVALLPLSSNDCFYNIAMDDNLGEGEEALAFARWDHRGTQRCFLLGTMHCTALVQPTRAQCIGTNAKYESVWPFESEPGDELGDNWHGLCRYKYEDGASYVGEWRAEKRHG